jgi:hypothetical protein
MIVLDVFSLSVLACIELCAMVWAADSTIVKESVVPAHEEGLIPLFNGKDLTGWEGDAKFRIVRHLLTEATQQELGTDWNAV